MSLPTRPGRTAAVGFAVGSAATAAICAYVGYRVVFSLFVTYDDEGYFLISLQEWLDHGQLYDGVYSEYGPAYFTLAGGLFASLGSSVDHDTARLITLVIWVLTSVLAGAALLRLTGSAVIGLAAQLLTFVALFIIRQDPMYPGAWLALILVAAVFGASFLRSSRPHAALFAVGVLIALATLVKINVGGFALIAVAVAAALTLPMPRRLAALPTAAGALVVAVPFLVMLGELGRGEVARYAAVVAIATAAIVVSVPQPRTVGLRLKDLSWFGAGMGAAAIVVFAVVAARGSSLAGMFEGILVQPLEHENVIDLRLNLPSSAVVWTVAGLGAAILLRRVNGPDTDRWLLVTGAARIAAGLLTWVMVAKVSVGDPTAFGPAAAFAWVAAVGPQRDVDVRTGLLRAAVPLIGVLNLLQAYPVASNQFRLSAVLLVFAGGIAVGDGLTQLSERFGARALALNVVFGAFAAWLLLAPADDEFRAAVRSYDDGPRLDLPGARTVRPASIDPAILRGVTAGLADRCPTFFSLPGLNSFYVWSGLDPPTGMNVGNWMFQFEADDQLEVRDQLRRVPGLCLLRNQALVDLWANGRPVPQRPLYVWIEKRFRPVTELGGYELLLRPAAQATPQASASIASNSSIASAPTVIPPP